MLQKMLVIAIAGAAGALCRFGLSAAVQRVEARYFGHPVGSAWGTAACNALGCLLFGLLFYIAESRSGFSPLLRAAMLVGFLGAFTTFSTFAFESTRLLQRGEWPLAMLNIVGQNALGLVMVLAGIGLARWWLA